MRRWLGAAFVVVIIAGCARVMAPPGGPRDLQPPRIIRTDPEQNSTASAHTGSRRPVRIFFDETISERSPREMVQVSPETGEIDVARKGKEIRVTIKGGWQPNRVYRVTVLPGIVDRFGNARPSAYDLVFSTGAPITPNVVGGIATDRITGRPSAGARVEAVSQQDSVVHTTVIDSAGFFAMRSLPPGAYRGRVYLDQNRNRILDFSEARAPLEFTVGATDTVPLELTLLAPDTTPARLVRATARDSLHVVLTFDDYMDPPAGTITLDVMAWLLPDSTLLNGGAVMTQREAARLGPPDTMRVTPPGQPAEDTTRGLPVNELVWIPPEPLRPSARYRVTVSGYRNLHGIDSGGGSVVFTTPAPPRPQPADSAQGPPQQQ